MLASALVNDQKSGSAFKWIHLAARRSTFKLNLIKFLPLSNSVLSSTETEYFSKITESFVRVYFEFISSKS